MRSSEKKEERDTKVFIKKTWRMDWEYPLAAAIKGLLGIFKKKEKPEPPDDDYTLGI